MVAKNLWWVISNEGGRVKSGLKSGLDGELRFVVLRPAYCVLRSLSILHMKIDLNGSPPGRSTFSRLRRDFCRDKAWCSYQRTFSPSWISRCEVAV